MNKIRRITTWLLLLCMVLTMVACGSGTKGANTVISNSSKPVEEKNDEDSAELTPEEIEAKKQFANSTPENDTDIGLKNIKIDTAERELTDVQKKIIQYFDKDYLHVEFYDFLRRYPDLFTNVQIDTYGGVSKLLEVGDKTYQFACGYSDEYGNPVYEMVVNCPINGTMGHTRVIEGDFLWIHGKLLGEQSFNIDGKSYVLPVIDAYYPTSIYEMGVVYKTNLYDLDYIKPIAESIFGDDIEIRQPTPEDGVQFEYSESENYLAPNEATVRDRYFVVELNNQSNAKFNKYLFDRESGAIIDMRATENIERRIEFSADFQHFFLFTYDRSLEILTLEYYDHNLDRVWKREFLETTNAVYDFTKNNVYLIANNELYIININTDLLTNVKS